jgi:flagellar hook-associated protein 2
MSSTVTALNSNYIQIIQSIMEVESQPLTRLTTARDNITTQKTIYTDLNSLFTKLQSSTKAMISSDPFYTFKPGRTVKVLASNNASVLSATAQSTAVAGNYNISVTSLAKAHRVMSTKQSGMTTDLNLSGSFVLGGAGTLSNATTEAGSVESFAVSANVASGANELGTGKYFTETRYNTDHWEYRLVDSSGAKVDLPAGNSSGWSTVPDAGGAVDTGRGLTINFGTSMQAHTYKNGAPSFTYTGGGRATISVATTDSLVDIASKINNTTFTPGKEIQANIIDSQLVLTAKQTGTAYTVSAKDSTGTVLQSLGLVDASGAFLNERAASDAKFTINDLPEITRSSNTGITDVINGLTINLASDAEGKTASLEVTADETDEKAVVDTFISNFNEMTKYLSAKLTTVKQADGTYKRGALAGESSLFSLRMDMMRMINSDSVNAGTLKNLAEIGLSLDTTGNLKISNSSKLETALTTNKTNVSKLVDTIMTKLDKTLDRYTGSSGFISLAQRRLDTDLDNTNNQITTLNQRLDKREALLYNQYAQTQAMLAEMSATQSTLAAIYST